MQVGNEFQAMTTA